MVSNLNICRHYSKSQSYFFAFISDSFVKVIETKVEKEHGETYIIFDCGVEIRNIQPDNNHHYTFNVLRTTEQNEDCISATLVIFSSKEKLKAHLPTLVKNHSKNLMEKASDLMDEYMRITNHLDSLEKFVDKVNDGTFEIEKPIKVKINKVK